MNHRVDKISRRDILRLTLISPLAVAVFPVVHHARTGNVSRLDKQVFINAPAKIVPVDPAQEIDKLKLDRQWKGDLCRTSIVNTGTKAVPIKEIVLFDVFHAL